MTSFYVRLWGDGLGSPRLSNNFLTGKEVAWWFLQSSTEFLREFRAAERRLPLRREVAGRWLRFAEVVKSQSINGKGRLLSE